MAQCPSVFITATEARQSPLRERAIHDEAVGIQSAILDAVKLGFFETTVSDGTPMTDSRNLPNDVWTVDPATDQLYIPNHGFSTGDAVTVSSTIALPAPLVSTAYYYVIYVDPDHIKLAASYANAISGRPISIDVTAGVTTMLINDEGSGYIQPPVVTLSGGSPITSATARAYLASWGSVVAIANTTSGGGYTDSPTVQIVPKGNGASAGTVSYMVVGMSIDNSGNDYHLGDILSVDGGTGTAATAVVTEVDVAGSILSISLSNPGTYTVLPVLAGASTSVMPGGGSGATVNLTMGIKSIAVADGGVDYTAPPRVEITDPSGVGVVATAMVIGGSVSSISVSNPGYGYVGVSSVSFNSGSNAAAIASLLPTSVSSVAVVDGGSSYTSVPSVSIDPVGSGASAGTVHMEVVSCQVTSSGIGYSADDYLLIAGGTSTENAYIRVTSVDESGRIRTYTLESGGSYTSLPGLLSNPVNGGTGTLAAFNLVMGVGSIDVGSAGSGYAVPPIVEMTAPSLGGTQAVAKAVITGGAVTSFDVATKGYGYTDVPSVTVSNGSGATAEAILDGTSVASITVDLPGSGYSYATVTLSGGGANVQATAVANIVGDTIGTIDIITAGSGYTSLPDITIDGDGAGASATAVLNSTGIYAISLITGGSGYNYPPAVNIDGSAIAASILNPTGIDRLIVTDQGSSYTASPTVYLIPGPYQTPTPSAPAMVPQMGYSVSSISVISSGTGYQTAPGVSIAPPQINGGTQATATAYIGAGAGTFALRPYPESRDYFKAWKGQQLSNDLLAKPYINRMDAVISYFTSLGYTINRLTNPSTNSTLMWKIQW
jgi:hypothetical protein